MRKRIRKFLREFPKVAILLGIVAAIMFPLYMMIVISFMTPAQLERFPWFPVKLPTPVTVESPRAGVVSLKPAVVTLNEEGREPREMAVPTDRRFYMIFSEASQSQDEWTEEPRKDSPGGGAGRVIAEYRAANVWEVEETGPGEYRVDGRAFAAPAGFESLLPGLQMKSAVQTELRAVEAAARAAGEALMGAESVERIKNPQRQRARRVEAVRALGRAEELLGAADLALGRAEDLSDRTRALNVSADETVAAARATLKLAHMKRDRALAKIGNGSGQLTATIETTTSSDTVATGAASPGPAGHPFPRARGEEATTEENFKLFKVERNEAVAVLRIERAARLRQRAGTLMVATEWAFPLNVRRPFAVRAVVKPTGPEGRELAAGTPLAELVTTGKMELERRDGTWWVDDKRTLDSYLPPGFVALALPEHEQNVRFSEGEVVARAAMPQVEAEATAGGALVVGLAAREGEILPGDGRWVYSLEEDRERPFVVRLDPGVTRRTDAGVTPLRVKAGAPLAALYVNRGRTVHSDGAGHWVSREGVRLEAGAGFVSRMEPPGPGSGETKSLAGDTVLAELAMPAARVIVDGDFVIVRMTGGDWSEGQWVYPLGELETIQVVPADGRGQLTATTEVTTVKAKPGELVAEVRVVRKTVLRYVDLRWETAEGVVIATADEYALQRARMNFETAARRLELARERGGADVTAAQAAYEQAWAEAERVDQAGAFVTLSGPGQVLDEKRTVAIVEAGTVLARLEAERPAAGETGGGAVTEVRSDGRMLRVGVRHELDLPVRALAAAGDGARVSAGQTAATWFTPQRWAWENYREAATYVLPFIANTVVVATVSMVLGLFFASLSAFVLVRFNFPGKTLFYGMLVVLLMIPGVLNLIPMYIIVKNMGLLNSLWAVILPAVAGAQVMNVYILRNNLETVAKDLFDAARIDGASNWQVYWHIAMPLSKPIMGTLAIFALLSEWNNFIWPWIVLKDMDKMTITAGLALLEGQNQSDYGLQMAGSVLASLPLVIMFLFMMNLFIRGIQSGAVKA